MVVPERVGNAEPGPMPADVSSSAASDDAPLAPVVALPSLAQSIDWTAQVTSVAIVRLDDRGRVRAWNPGAQRIKGYAAEEIVGRSFEDFYRPQDRERGLPQSLLERAAREGTAESTGWRVRADGSTFWAHTVITAIRAADGTLAGYVKLTRDLTARRREDERRELLLRGFAHDVLSPITALRGYADLLEEAAPEHADLISRIATVGDHVTAMVEQLRAGLDGADADPAAMVEVAQSVWEAGELVLPGDGIERLRVAGDDALRVRTRPATLRRVLANVIDNAAKYSDGAIEVEIDASGDGVAVRVIDAGRGIAAEDLDTIFDPHVRGRLADPGDGGSGVGLASVREETARLGGRVSIASELGAGTVVTIELPHG